MTEASIQRLTSHYDSVAPRMTDLTEAFYARLFEALPETRQLFRIEIPVQSQHLAAAMAMIIRNLRLLDLLEVPLMDLGAEHAKVGVLPQHYPVVCQTMLQTLCAGSAEKWSSELESDWRAVLEHISRVMMAGAIKAAAASR